MLREAWIYTDYVSEFKEKIAKLNRKAIRLGATKITLTVTSDTKIEKIKNKDEIEHEYHFTKIIVEGENPKLNGWSLVATLVHDSDLGVMVNVVPEKTLDPKYRDSTGYCDHCKTKRFRKETFVVEHENGDVKEVGRQCIADFLGSDKIGKFIWSMEWPKMFEALVDDFERGYGSRIEPVFNTRTFLATAVKVIKENGYVSKTKAEELNKISTSGLTIYLYDGDRYNNIPPYRPTNEEYEMADKVIEWVKTIDTTSDYNFNINKLANNDSSNYRFSGYVVSMIAAYNKEMDLIERKKNDKKSEHIGILGKRELLELTYVNEYGWDTMYGFQICYKFVDMLGNIVVWKSLNKVNFEKDKAYKIKATFKKHAEYKGINQTEISRAVVEG